MSSLDVQRRLTEVLHRHAEDAMSTTDTQKQLQEFLARDGHEPRKAPRRNRRTAVLGAGLATAAAAAAVFWGTGLTEDRTQPAPVVEPAPDPVQVAEEYVAAYAAYDTEKVVAMADPRVDLAEVRLYQARDEAFGIEFLTEPCREGSTGSVGTQVACPFALHVMSSEELGRGPFENASFNLLVTPDGKVLEADADWNFELNGMAAHYDGVVEWVFKTHPDQVPFLEIEEQDVPPAQLDRWLGLWRTYIQEYVDAHTKG